LERAGGTWRESPLPLALTLLLHAVLLLAWMQGRTVRRAPDLPQREISILLPARAAPARPRVPPPVRRPVTRAPAPAGPPAMPAPAPTAPPVAAPAPQPAAPALPPTPSGADIAARARRDAGRVYAELSGGKSAVPDNPDTAWSRFANGVDGAHIESARTETMETYTSPDGVVIYRFRQGNRVRCRMTGGVGLGIPGGYTLGQQLAGAGSAGGAGNAGFVPCPTDKPHWVRQ
jgi:hypothetical protein